MADHRSDHAKRDDQHDKQRLDVRFEFERQQHEHAKQRNDESVSQARHRLVSALLLTFPADSQIRKLGHQIRHEAGLQIGHDLICVADLFIQIGRDGDRTCLIDAIDFRIASHDIDLRQFGDGFFRYHLPAARGSRESFRVHAGLP